MSKNNLGETLIMGMSQHGRVQSKVMQANHHVIRLNCDITAPEDFNEELNIIYDMTENDTCEILINTGGGYLATAMEFLDAMSCCEGHVHTRITGSAHSAGSMIFLAGHSFSLSDYSEMLIHNGSGGAGGKISDLFSQTDHDRKHHSRLFHSIYRDFLTTEEVEDVLRGIDIWLDKDQIEERLERMVEIRTARLEAEAEEQAEAFIEAELEGCEEYPVEDTSGHEYQLGSGLNKSCVNCQACACEDKAKNVRAKVGVKYDWSGWSTSPWNLREGDLVNVWLKDGCVLEREMVSACVWDYSDPSLGEEDQIVAYELVLPEECVDGDSE